MSNLVNIKLDQIMPNPVALRTVDTQSENFIGMVDSMKQVGVLNAITVREKVLENGLKCYELVDGLHRFTSAKAAGLTEIPASIVNFDDSKTLEAQIMANVHRQETKPIEYSRALVRLIGANALMTETELALKLGKSPQWIRERLGLVKISDPEIQKLVDTDKICLANAYGLAKLDSKEQADFLDRAMTMPADEFVPAVQARVKEIRDAKRQGGEAAPAIFEPVAFAQKMSDVKSEIENGEVAQFLCQGLVTAQDGFRMALKWFLHLDPRSIEAQKAKDEARKQATEDAAKKRKVEQAQKAAEKAEKLQKAAAEAAEKAKAALAGK